ncbi:DoxX family protein [Geminisphaera colitermitum]|uniref:DoxX family protein n=1 Tax=Geminisphaera colitermitum TaxID=1148786 RepID=UPI0005BA9D3C|nr:DoxX family protein [Geminisphaera colitermitum]
MNKLIRPFVVTRASNWAALPVRLAVGGVLFAHGAQKLLGWWGGYGLQATASHFADKLHLTPGIFWASLAAGGEFVGGAAILLGLFTRFFGLTAAVIMAVAIATVHNSAFFLPNGMEYALTLLLGALSLIFSGGGALSADALLFRSSNTTKIAPKP